jgi:hypothetical protein
LESEAQGMPGFEESIEAVRVFSRIVSVSDVTVVAFEQVTFVGA